RTTTLIVRIVKRWPRVEASMARARCWQAGGEMATTQRRSAGKQLVTSRSRRFWPRLAPRLSAASRYQSRRRSRIARSPQSRRDARGGQAAVLCKRDATATEHQDGEWGWAEREEII